jgi:hypothetical protein
MATENNYVPHPWCHIHGVPSVSVCSYCIAAETIANMRKVDTWDFLASVPTLMASPEAQAEQNTGSCNPSPDDSASPSDQDSSSPEAHST